MKRIGKKGKQWLKDRIRLIEEAFSEGRIDIKKGIVWGICEDCGKYRILTPDHRRKRSLGGGNEKENISWVCIPCHNLRDNMGDPRKKKETSKKADWQKDHPCKNCKVTTGMLLCHNCGKMSV